MIPHHLTMLPEIFPSTVSQKHSVPGLIGDRDNTVQTPMAVPHMPCATDPFGKYR